MRGYTLLQVYISLPVCRYPSHMRTIMMKLGIFKVDSYPSDLLYHHNIAAKPQLRCSICETLYIAHLIHLP